MLGKRSFGARELLESHSSFEGIERSSLESLLKITGTRRLKSREILFRKGDSGTALYGVMTGRLRATGAGADGKEVIFGFIDAGELFGEIALLDSNPRSATIEAVEACELITLQRRDLIPFLERHPRVAIRIASFLAAHVRRLTEEMEDTLFLTVPVRLAKKLSLLGRSYGEQTATGLRIDLKLPQQELGELIGATRESINKQLRAWSDEGVLSFDRGIITVHDAERLKQLGDAFQW